MDENEKKENSKFKTVSNKGTYHTVYEIDNKSKHKSGFGKSIVLPFFSGVVGCALVIGTCFRYSIY